MKKIIEKIVVLTLLIIIISISIFNNFSSASEGSIAVSTATVGSSFTVTVNIPSDAVAYEGRILVTFSDGTTQQSKKLVESTGVSGEFKHPGNMTASFTAVKEGQATAKVTGLIISSKNGQINTQETLSTTFTINSKPAETPTQSTSTDTTNANSGTNSNGQNNAGTTTGDTSSSTSGSTSATPNTTSTTPGATNSNEPTWRNTGDTVYALENLNVRNSWDTTAATLGRLTQNASTKRIAVGSNGWDKIEFNGTTGYVVSRYLTTKNPKDTTSNGNGDSSNSNTNTNTNTQNTADTTNTKEPEEPTWTKTNDTVYALQNINVRSGWGTTFSSIGGLSKNASIKRIAKGSNGWDKVSYNGITAYVLSRLVTTKEPEIDNTNTDVVNNSTDNNLVNNTNVIDNNLVNQTDNSVIDGEMYNKIVAEVGVIPAVGKSISNYIYIISTIISVIIIAYVSIKIREKNFDK